MFNTKQIKKFTVDKTNDNEQQAPHFFASGSTINRPSSASTITIPYNSIDTASSTSITVTNDDYGIMQYANADLVVSNRSILAELDELKNRIAYLESLRAESESLRAEANIDINDDNMFDTNDYNV